MQALFSSNQLFLIFLTDIQFTGTLQFRIAPLPQDFIGCNGNRVREVQASQRVPHRNANALVCVGVQERFWKSFVLPSKDEIHAVQLGVNRIAVDVFAFGGEEIELVLFVCMFCDKVRLIIIIRNIQLVPIVQTGTL